MKRLDSQKITKQFEVLYITYNIIIRWADQAQGCWGREPTKDWWIGQTTEYSWFITAFVEAKEEEFKEIKAQLESMIFNYQKSIDEIKRITEQNEAIRKEKAELDAKTLAMAKEKEQLAYVYGY